MFSNHSNPKTLLVCSCDALKISDELEQLKDASKKELNSSYDETDELKIQSNNNEQRILKLQEEMKLLKKELEKSKDREWSLRKRNSKLISKLDDSSQKKKEPAYMRAMFHKTSRSATLSVMNLTKFDAAFTRSSSSYKCEQDDVNNNQTSKSLTQTCISDSAEAETKSNASSSNSSAQSSTENFFHYRRFSGLHKRRNNSDDSFVQDVSRRSSISRRLSNEDEECINDHPPLDVQMKEIESKVDEIEELKLKMKSRDLIINCMEETLQTDIRNMQYLLEGFESKVQL